MTIARDELIAMGVPEEVFEEVERVIESVNLRKVQPSVLADIVVTAVIEANVSLPSYGRHAKAEV